jgi:hypothetical protein
MLIFGIARGVISSASVNSDGDKVIFISARNEWAEGCHLEPDRKLVGSTWRQRLGPFGSRDS